MLTSFPSRILLVLLFAVIPLHLICMGFRLLRRRSRLGPLRAVHSAVFLLFVPILLSAIFALPEVSHLPREEGAVSELTELKLKISQLESILEKNIKDLDSKVSLLQEKDSLIEEMSSKIQYLQNFLRNMKKSRGGSVYSEERVSSLEEEVRNLWGEARKNNFDLHTLQSKAYDAEEKLDSVSSQVLKMEDIITEQWIQIRQLEQALQVTKVRTSKAYRKIKSTGCTLLKFINGFHQHHLPEASCHLRSFFFKKSSVLGPYLSHVFNLVQRISLGVRICHHELQGYVRQMMEKYEFTADFANQEVIFFLVYFIISGHLSYLNFFCFFARLFF
uniref:Homeobox protein cut-like ceh-44 n=1 Tax=Anthurium amnicola TaxID=1678845 RepID=A0A1D1XS97_9ARAE